MSKKKDKEKNVKKDKIKSFTKVLKENQKSILVKSGDETITLKEATTKSVENMVISPLDGLISIPASEAAENALLDTSLMVSTHYAQSVFSMYEFTMRYPDTKQTLIITVMSDEIDEVLSLSKSIYGPLRERSSIGLIIPQIPDKKVNQIRNWAENAKGADMYVIRIPGILLFTGDIKKDVVSNTQKFDLIIQILHTSKSLEKLRKKDKDEYERTVDFYLNGTSKVLTDMGVVCAHMPLIQEFYSDPHEYAQKWAKQLTLIKESNKLLARMVFSTINMDDLVSFNAEIGKCLGETAISTF